MENTTATPNVTLGQYKGLPVTRHVRPVSEKAVEQELAHLARTHTVYQHTVAAAQRGDRVVLDFEGFMNGQSIPDSKMEHVSVVLGEGDEPKFVINDLLPHLGGEQGKKPLNEAIAGETLNILMGSGCWICSTRSTASARMT